MSKVFVIAGTGSIGNQLVRGLLENSDLLNVVQGDYENIVNFKNAIAGHERLFYIVASSDKMAKYKRWRSRTIDWMHLEAEQEILSIPKRGYYVALRSAGLLTNQLWGEAIKIMARGLIVGSLPGDKKKAWISPPDIARLARNVLTDLIEKNKDAVYEMASVGAQWR